MAGRKQMSIHNHEARKEGGAVQVEYGEEGSLFVGKAVCYVM
jgi:hypothetical protein